ncbi:hypothetical protein OAH12_00035 [Cyclobacteriaceae bacterium]|nr:hypothetical protein [Cyclobacteriaceae bacterium]
MTHDYRYSAFGFTISSDIPIPELIAIDTKEETDIVITEKEIVDKPLNDHWYSVTDGRLLFQIDEVARFEVLDGQRISYQPFEGVDLDNLRLFILGSGLAAIFHQRRLYPLHGSSFVVNDQVIVITGDSGVGKSTAAYEFVRQGYALIADDVSLISEKGIVASGYPQMKLWKASLDLFGLSSTDLKRVRKEDEKYRIAPEKFHKEGGSLHKIFFLENVDDGFEISELKGMPLLELLSKNLFRPFFAYEDELTQKIHFDVFSFISQHVKCYLVQRNKDQFETTYLVDEIIKMTDEICPK